jgi:hypothetical protein
MRKVLFAATAAATLTAAALLVPAAASAAPKALVCDGTVNGGTYFAVVVPAGASCTLIDAKVTHGVRARNAANVRLISTDVARNINIRGTTGLTEIGTPADPFATRALRCNIDPMVGNNLMVRNSHDVLICQVDAKNNIMITGNDGQITVRDSVARGNIMVNRNPAWVGPPLNKHPNPSAIRLLRDTAGHHIHVFHNAQSRDLIFIHVDPAPEVR